MSKYPFTYYQEIGHQGQSLVPHFPGARSGVTIGPGYDMGHRSPQEIYTDLTRAGIDPEMAYQLIDAAHKTGPEAQNWVAGRGGIYITEQQQQTLFEKVLVPEYEERARQQIIDFVNAHPTEVSPEICWESLSSKQQEILFDYVYNAGSISRFPEMTAAVLNQDWDTASLHYERFSGEMPLAYRNEMFFREFLDPTYLGEQDSLALAEALEASAENADQEISDLYADERDGPDPTENFDTKDPDEWFEHI